MKMTKSGYVISVQGVRVITAIAFDPGRTTGYAIACVDDEGLFICYDEEKMDHKRLWDFVPLWIDHIICETFEFRQGKAKTGVDLYPCELIGVLHMRDQSTKVELHMQDPWVQSGKKVYYSDTKLKDMNFYQSSPHHGRSAVKHMLYWFKFGAGFQYTQGHAPELVSEVWIRRKISTSW